MSTTRTCTTLPAGSQLAHNQPARPVVAVHTRPDSDKPTSLPTLESYGLPRRLPLAQRVVISRRVTVLEGRLFDDDDHLRRNLDGELIDTLLGEINELRHDLGWLRLDRHHHQVWPQEIAS